MRQLILLVGVLTLVSCGGDSTGPVATLDGDYDLTTVNGVALPITRFQNATEKDELLGDAYFASNGSFTQGTANRVTINGTTHISIAPNSGTYVVDGLTITFIGPGGTFEAKGSPSGDTFTMTFNGTPSGAAVYVRR